MSVPDLQPSPGSDRAATGETWRLGLLFGALSFLQGIGDPTFNRGAQEISVWLTLMEQLRKLV